MKNMIKLVVSAVIIGVLTFAGNLNAQINTGDFSVTYSESGSGTTRTIHMYVPSDYDSTKSYPLLYAWHGSGMPGSMMRTLIKSTNDPIGAIICCPDVNSMTTGTQLSEMINRSLSYLTRYNIDESARVITGFSMGGNYAFQIGLLNNTIFEGIIGLSPAIGSAQMSQTMWDNIHNINMATILGDQDFNYAAVDQLMKDIINKGGFLEYKVKPGVTHSDNVYFNSQEFKDDFFDCWQKVLGISGLKEISSLQMDIYPNPVQDLLTIKLGSNSNNPVTISVFNTLGKLEFQQNMHNPINEIQLSLTNFSNGVYFIKVEQDGLVTMKKIVKE